MPTPSGVAFLLSQLGAHVTQRLAGKLATADLTPAHLGVLRAVGQNPGLSQKALAEHLRAFPSRVVRLLDELEARGLIERRRSETDRRNHELYIAPDAGETMTTVLAAVAENDTEITRALTPGQRRQLVDLLSLIAVDQGLPAAVHPGLGLRP